MEDNTKQTIIESGTEFDGSIESDCAITLSGTLRGKVSAPGLTVTPSGRVDGQIKVSRLKMQGEVSGQIDAEDVELSGHVGDQTVIRAKTLEVSLAQPEGGLQVTFGNCDLQIGDTKTRSAERHSRRGSSRRSTSSPL
jgi:cytoskeletal protein CcmA (bactofilin family)